MMMEQAFIAALHEAAIRKGNGDEFIAELQRTVDAGTASDGCVTYLRRARLVQQQEGAKQ